jgi:16S rRNA (guanine527-N7)-methyltransferase
MKPRKNPPGGRAGQKGGNDRPRRLPQGKPGGYGRPKDAEGRPIEGGGQPGGRKKTSGRPSGSKARQEGPRTGGSKPSSGTPYAGKGSVQPKTGPDFRQGKPFPGKPFPGKAFPEKSGKPFPGKPHAAKGNTPDTGGPKPFRGKPFAGKGGDKPKPFSGQPGKTDPEKNEWSAPKQKRQKRLSAPPSMSELGRLMSLYGVELPPKTLERLWGYHQLLRANNGDQDLTRLIGFDTIAQRHYADCMILHGMMRGKWPSPLVDVGSGAGFPGIMIKLMSPETEIVLAEPRPRRVEFLEMVIRNLGLRGISVFGHKVTSRSLTQPFAGAITRAFETVESTLPRLGGCLGVGGQAIFMKGPKVAEEMAVFDNDEYKVLRNQAYKIPNTIQDRVLVILERTKVPGPGEARPFDPSEEADFASQDSEDA